MLQWFTSFSEFTEFSESSAPFRENPITSMVKSVRTDSTYLQVNLSGVSFQCTQTNFPVIHKVGNVDMFVFA